jgi:methylmalonyl-CoA mutase cobalamin-binding subunit
MLRKDGVVASFSGENKSPAEICDLIKRFTPDFIFVSCVAEECMPAAVELVKAIRTVSAQVSMVATGPAAREHSDELIEAGISQICASTSEARRAVRSFILQRAKSRSHFGTLLPRRYARGNS